MLAESDVATRLPAQDLSRARKFYSEKLGLEPVEERPGAFVIGAAIISLLCSNPQERHRAVIPRWDGRFLILKRP
jgi:catechol 2,3-dioxygenase-like lactoylglutathione lyase family enzyme